MTRSLNSIKQIGVFTYDYLPLIGGIGRHLASIVSQINSDQESKYQLNVYSPNQNKQPEHRTIYSICQKIWAKNIAFSVLLNAAINKIASKNKLVGLIIPGGPGGILLCRKPNVPLIYIANHTYQQQIQAIKNEAWKKIFIPFEQRAYQIADKIIAISPSTKASLEQDYAISSDKIAVITPGLAYKVTEPNISKKTTGSILYVGRLDRRKGFDQLLLAMINLKNYSSTFHLHVASNSLLSREQQDLIKKHNLSDHISLHNKLHDAELFELYKSCSIQVVPSLLEGFGITCLEGLSQGTAIVASRVAGLQDIIQHEANGLLFESGNIQDLTSSILRLLEDQALRKRLVSVGYASLSRYEWSKLLKEYRAVFGEVFG